MFIDPAEGASTAPPVIVPPVTVPSATVPSVSADALRSAKHPEHVRHLLFGTPATVQATIRLLHHCGYAEPNDWSRPISTGRPNEVMAILTKRINP